METTLALHERIIKACAENLAVGGYNFEFVLGDTYELNNETDNIIQPVVCLEQESILDLGGNKEQTETLTMSILFLSRLGDVSNERSSYYELAKQALIMFSDLLSRVRMNSAGELVFNAQNGLSIGKKVLRSFEIGRALRVKNKYSSNRDGVLLPNLRLNLVDIYNICAL
jgi:hypothetical protein